MIGEQTPYRFVEQPHGHWYDNKQMYGTTTVTDVIGKSLSYWSSGLACAEFGWINPNPSNKPKPDPKLVDEAAKNGLNMVKQMDLEGYKKLLGRAYKAHKTSLDESAKIGNQLHKEAEMWVNSQLGISPPLLFISPKLQPFVDWCKKSVQKFLFAEACHYSSQLFTGGKDDLIFLDFQDRIVLGDYKSAPKAYFSNFVQSGSYSIQIKENGLVDASGKRLAEPFRVDRLAIFPFGGGFVEPVYQDNVEEYEEAFKAALVLHKSKRKYEGE